MRPDPSIYDPLAQLLLDLRNDPELSVDPEALAGMTHRRVFEAALNGTILAERINGRWYTRRANRQKNAELLGVMPKRRVGRSPRRTASVPSNAAVA